MRAAWDWDLPVETTTQQREIVEIASEIGFDTLIVQRPTEPMVRRAHELGVSVVAIVTAGPQGREAAGRSGTVQRLLPEEEEIASACARRSGHDYQKLSHRWFPIVLSGDLLCFENESSREALKSKIDEALELADGVAFDGFGFRNHYACFCERCDRARQRTAEEHPEWTDAEVLRDVSERSLVGVSSLLFEHAKSRKPEALVTNHVWPPFRPNWYYGWRLRLDYCSQTISWFYHPHWSIERVTFVAQEHKRLEDRTNNTFVPFIGLYGSEDLVRSPERVRTELDVARRFGDGHVVVCTLGWARSRPEIAAVVKSAVARFEGP